MKMAARNVIMSAMLISVCMASACGGPTGQPASTHGTSGTNAAASGTNAAASGTNAAASGTNAAASGTNAAAGTSQPTHKGSGSPSSGSSTTVPATSNNQVILDPDTAIHGFPYDFGRTFPRLPRTLQFGVTSRYKQPVAIHISSDSQYFVATENCNHELQPGDSCSFSVTFSAPRNGSYGAILHIAFSGSRTVSIALTANVGVAVNTPPTQTAPGNIAPTQSASSTTTPSGAAGSG